MQRRYLYAVHTEDRYHSAKVMNGKKTGSTAITADLYRSAEGSNFLTRW